MMAGSGRPTSGPVIFLHGAGQDARAAQWLDVPGMVALNLPGHGGRKRQRPGMRVADIADEIAGWASEPLHVVGAGVGGNVAMVLALDYPQLVRSLVIASAIAYLPNDDLVEERARLTESLGPDGQRDLIQGAMERWFSAAALAKTPRPAPLAYAEAQAAKTGKGAMADIWRAFLGFDVRDRIGTINVPTTCVGGCYDTQTLSSEIAELASSIPRAQFVEVKAAHMAAHLEVPDEFSAVVRNHLAAFDQ